LHTKLSSSFGAKLSAEVMPEILALKTTAKDANGCTSWN
jgi:hypothetical protein